MNNIFDRQDVKEALRTWWEDLDNRRGERAHLRRCPTLANTLNLRGTKRLHDALTELGLHAGKEQEQQVGTVAGLLAHVRSDAPEATSLGRLMAVPVAEEGRPVVSEQRFRRLLRLRDRGDLYPQMIRIIRLLDGRAPVVALARDLFYWNDRTRHAWARNYYAQALRQTEVATASSFKEAVFDWWETLADHNDERAELRRCTTPDEVLLLRGFHRLQLYIDRAETDGQCSDQQLAIIAGVLSHVKPSEAVKNQVDDTFAQQMALPQKYVDPGRKRPKRLDGKARVSGLRFRRLLQITDRNDLFRPLIRVIHQLGGEANVQALANDLYFWRKTGKTTRQRWATDYYKIAPKDEV